MAAVLSFKQREKDLRTAVRNLRSVADAFHFLGRQQQSMLSAGDSPAMIHTNLATKFSELMALVGDLSAQLSAESFTYPLEVRVSPNSMYNRLQWDNGTSSLTVNRLGNGDKPFDLDGADTTNIFNSDDVVEVKHDGPEQTDNAGNNTNVVVAGTQTAQTALIISNPTALTDGHGTWGQIRLVER